MSTITVSIESLTHDGRGIARVDGMVYFIEGALPGEQVEIVPIKRRRSHRQAKLERILQPSPQRVEPECQYFGVCGGCALQHLDATAQLGWKQNALLENLAKIGNAEVGKVLPPIRGEPFYYRRKARLGIRYVPKKGGILVGFRERHKSYITPLETCHTLTTGVVDVLPKLPVLVAGLSCYSRLPQIEVSAGDNALALVLRHLEPLTPADHYQLVDFAKREHIQIYLQPGGLDTVHALWPENPEPLFYTIPEFNIKLEFGPTDFIQVNADINRRLIAKAIELLDIGSEDSILDLFCGLGNFTLPIASKAASVIGLEGDSLLVTRARNNASLNQLNNVEFVAVDLFAEKIDLPVSLKEIGKILLDPPRTGAIEAIKQLVPKIKPDRIVYVSCNPATLARDAAILVHKFGYRFISTGVINMFPHTAHVESIALFER